MSTVTKTTDLSPQLKSNRGRDYLYVVYMWKSSIAQLKFREIQDPAVLYINRFSTLTVAQKVFHCSQPEFV